MTEIVARDYYRGRWPEEPIPDGEPIWLFYEVDKLATRCCELVTYSPMGALLATVWYMSSGTGDECPSLIDCSLGDLFDGGKLEEIPCEQFEEGIDAPVWFVR